jgi:citrate lyase subunit beta/citryl-CoA lyase
MAVRSYLRVPAEPAALAGAAGSGADAIVVDLSSTDGLADVRDWLAETDDRPEIWVKLDAAETDHADLRRVVKVGLSGVCVTGISSAAEIAALGAELAEVEELVGLAVGSVAVAPVLTTASGVLNAQEIARAPRVSRLHLDETALRIDLGVEPGPDERELLWVRSQTVLASAAARIAAPAAPAPPLYESCVALRRLGFGALECLDATRLPMVNKAFA